MQELVTNMKADFFKALAHPSRIRILERIAEQEVCVCELVDELGLEQSNLSQHLAVLRKQHIVTCTKVGLKTNYRIKHPEVLEILQKVQAVLTSQLMESEALMRHMAEAASNSK